MLNPRTSVNSCHFKRLLVVFEYKVLPRLWVYFWFCWGTYLPKIWVSRPSSTQSQTVTDLSPTHTSSRTAEFMSKLRFFQHTCLLSFQKASLAINLCFSLFFGIPPPDRFVPSQVTLGTWFLVKQTKSIYDKILIKINTNFIYGLMIPSRVTQIGML